MSSSKKIRAHVFVKGRVQGVYFRQKLRIAAKRRKVTGWVRNLNDGRVEALLEGNDRNVSEVIEWCHAGPAEARVDDVRVEYEPHTGEFSSFEVKY
ncbi:MAG: acylphosphatase [Nitrososphaerales archaeon]